MARKNRIQESLDRATENANRQIVATALADLPASTTIRDLHAAMSKSTVGSTFESMTLAELRDALGGAPSPQRKTRSGAAASPAAAKTARRNINTRTQAGRAALDTAVRDFLRANGASRSEKITPNVAGDTAQVRQALKRMIENGEVIVKGNRRASEYSLTSRTPARSTPGRSSRKKAAKKKSSKRRSAKK